jgi:hypothetical protein
MHTKIRLYPLILLLWTVAATAQPSSSRADYSLQLDADNILCLPTQMHFALERVSDTFWVTAWNNPQGVFLATDEKGELFLMEHTIQRKLLHVDAPGNFIELVAVGRDDDGLLIRAIFQSSGATNPHQVAIRLSPAADGWQATSIDSPPPAPIADSPPGKTEQIQVHETTATNYVSYAIERPAIGNKSTRWATPYAVLPANGKKVFFAERGKSGIKQVPGVPLTTGMGDLLRKK